MTGTAALLIDLENFFIGREDLYHKAHGDDLYEFPIDLDSLCSFASDIAGGRRLVVRRAYANFNDRRPGEGERRWDYYLQPQPRFLMEQGIEPVQVFRFPGGSNKNAADMRLAMDATALLSGRSEVDQFIIVTGDSDFIPLVLEIKRSGAEVVVIGVSGCTKPIFARYCDRFEYFEDLLAARELRRDDHTELEPVRVALHQLLARRSPIKFAAVKPLLADALDHSFDPTRFGVETTGDFLRRYADAVGLVVRRGEHDWEIDLLAKNAPLENGIGGVTSRPAITADHGNEATTPASASSPPMVLEHRAGIYADLLRQGIPRCYVVGYEDWNTIVDAVWNCINGEDGTRTVFYHQELLTEATEICVEQGVSDASRKVRDAMFQLFKSGCFLCAVDGASPGQDDFHWSKAARLDPAIKTADEMVARAWGYLVELLTRRLEQRGLGTSVLQQPLTELLGGTEPSPKDAGLIASLLNG